MKAGRELDGLIADKVMGLPSVMKDETDGEWLYRADPPILGWNFVPPYSTSIEAAWQVVEKMNLFDNCEYALTKSGNKWAVIGHRVGGLEYYGKFSLADTAPIAICLAALSSVGVEVPHD